MGLRHDAGGKDFAQRKNLRIARFLNRIVFCCFAEDTGLLPKSLFSELLKTGIDDPRLLAETLEKLFAVMARGGTFGKDKIPHFNGHLFEESTVFEFTEDELRERWLNPPEWTETRHLEFPAPWAARGTATLPMQKAE
jgi:hypothetical protein